MGTISRILGSRKAVFTLLAMCAAMAMAWTARITGKEALDFMKWVLGAWIFAQAAEDGIMHWKGTHPGAQLKLTPVPAPAAPTLLTETAPAVPPAASSDPPGASLPPGSSEPPPSK